MYGMGSSTPTLSNEDEYDTLLKEILAFDLHPILALPAKTHKVQQPPLPSLPEHPPLQQPTPVSPSSQATLGLGIAHRHHPHHHPNHHHLQDHDHDHDQDQDQDQDQHQEHPFIPSSSAYLSPDPRRIPIFPSAKNRTSSRSNSIDPSSTPNSSTASSSWTSSSTLRSPSGNSTHRAQSIDFGVGNAHLLHHHPLHRQHQQNHLHNHNSNTNSNTNTLNSLSSTIISHQPPPTPTPTAKTAAPVKKSSHFLQASFGIDLDEALDHPSLASDYLKKLKTRKQQEKDQIAETLTSALQEHYNFQNHRSNRMNNHLASANADTNGMASDYSKSVQSRSTPITLKDSHSRLVNGLKSLTALEQNFNQLRIADLELINTPESTIRAVLADIYKISEELHMHLQGGPLNDNARALQQQQQHQQDRARDDDASTVVISGWSQRQKRIKDLLERIARETSVYEEFVKQAAYLNLDSILNEASDEDDEEMQGFARVDNELSEQDFDSESHNEDTLSQHSHASNNFGRLSSLPPSPMSPMSVRSSTLRPHSASPFASVPRAESIISSVNGGGARASSVSYSVSGGNHNSESTFGPGGTNGLSGHGGEGAQPWEAFRWTHLLKLSDQTFSDETKDSFGLGTCIAVSSVIAIGTSRGAVQVFDSSQTLLGVFGTGAQFALEHGSVCSIAISTDHTHIAVGHSLGSVIVWNISRTTTPTRVIPPINKETALAGRKLGHLRGSAILHIGFVGIKSTEVVSADDQGMSFHHLLYKVMMVNAVETIRLLGKYPEPKYMMSAAFAEKRGLAGSGGGSPTSVTSASSASAARSSTVLGMGVLPYGQSPHAADGAGLVGLLTPYKMLIVCIKPQPRTLFKLMRPKKSQTGREIDSGPVASGNLAWFPAMKSSHQPRSSTNDAKESVGATGQESNPLVAFNWNRHLYIYQVVKAGSNHTAASPAPAYLSHDGRKPAESNGKHAKLEFVPVGDWVCREGIVGIQWIRSQILLLLTNTEEIIVFDPKAMCETERCSARSIQIVYHDWFKDKDTKRSRASAAPMLPSPLGAEVAVAKKPVFDMSYNNSWRAYKGKLFVLGVKKVQVGTVLNWTDRILALVKSGDFLEGIALATLFYTGKSIQAAVVGLPEDPTVREELVSEKIYELLLASLNYTFNAERMMDVDDDVAAGGVGAGTVLFHDLAVQSIETCLAIDDQGFLFDTVYERYAEAKNDHVHGIFLQSLEPYILQDLITEMPPQVMQAFVKCYNDRKLFKELEQCICHTPCHVLEMDQIVDLCQRQQLYNALIYVWNKSIGDYVSPVVELLKVIKRILKGREQQSQTENAFSRSLSVNRAKAPQGNHQNGHDRPNSADSADRISDEEVVQLLYKYLTDVLLGRSYPDGIILEDSEATPAKVSLYGFIFSGRCVMWPPIGGKLILTRDENDADDHEPTYPYLRMLLHYDCNDFLKVMDQAFGDRYLSNSSQEYPPYRKAGNADDGPGKSISPQVIINTLLEVMTPNISFASQSSGVASPGSLKGSDRSSPAPNGNGSAEVDVYRARDVAHLYCFVSRNYAKNPKSLVLSPTTLHRILTRLSSDTDPETQEERQVAVQALLKWYSPGNETTMMALYEQAGFYRVLEKMYRAQKQFGPLIMTYLKDPERRSLVFETVQKLLSPTRAHRSALTEKQRTDIVKTMMEHVAEVVDIDGEQAAILVHKYLNAEHRTVLSTLQGSKPRLFAYLRGLLEPSSAYSEGSSRAARMQKQNAGADLNMDLLTTVDDSQGLGGSGNGITVITDPEIHELYIELLCLYDPSGVYDYLETHQDNSYRLERVLPICEKAGVVDAVVWILEWSGNANGALAKVLEIVHDRIQMLTNLVKAKPKGRMQDAYWSMDDQSAIRASLVRLRGVLNVGKQLCERSSRKSQILGRQATTTNSPLAGSTKVNGVSAENETETLWFQLLQVFVKASRKMNRMLDDNKGQEVTGEEAEKKHTGAGALAMIENAPPALFPNTGAESAHSFNVANQLAANFHGFVQSILTTLLLSTSTPQVSLPSLLRRLLQSPQKTNGNGATTSTETKHEEEELYQFADYKDIFMGMLDTFKYEGQLLEMTNGLFESDLFLSVRHVAKSRAKGWRPKKGNCEICGGAFWGPSVVRDLWVQQQKEAALAIKAALTTQLEGTPGQEATSSLVPAGADTEGSSHPTGVSNKDLVLFRCGHGYHRQCLDMETSITADTAAAAAAEAKKHVLECGVCNGQVKALRSQQQKAAAAAASQIRAQRASASASSHTSSNSRYRSRRRVKGDEGWVNVPGNHQRHQRHQQGSSGGRHSMDSSSAIADGDRPDPTVRPASTTLQVSPDAVLIPVRPPKRQDTMSPGPGGYQSSNEYEAAISPSMMTNKGKQKATY